MNENHFLALYVASALLLVVIVFFIILYVLIYSRKQQKNRMERTRMIHDHEKTLFSARLEEQERAMQQISREIHDNVAQKIMFTEMNLGAIEFESPSDPKSKFITNAQSLLVQVTADLRNVSYSLNSDYLKERGLGEVLSKELAYIGESRNIRCTLHMEEMYRTLPPDQELLIYRIAQEALLNAAKHSKATAIDISLVYNPDKFVMTVSDNGVGFDRNQADFLNGLGFRNMKQRAEILGAELNVEATPSKGCTVVLEVDASVQPQSGSTSSLAGKKQTLHASA